ncbi:Transcription-repair-coupling factor [Fundidesulfovibrio magnetotacticus]|uniref:Transcription-repair-coupling factor n=1 Tax=Fundidesulfovibrio magnetotacticus TaxID=2730080 RepID=A0A6V8M1U3_9BACT|nr:transcription-repair coupling factor [Fundidesulfovibrio magnetotacticus]GFK95807.1 Transcription-repair-coupling factor [Fundidesulfovibrio magnetotacticus]
MAHPDSPLGALLSGKSQTVSIYKSGPGSVVALCRELVHKGRSVVLVAPGAADLAQLTALLALHFPPGGEPLDERPWAALPSYVPGPPGLASWARRWAFLHAAANTVTPKVLCLSVENLLPKWPPRQALEHSVLEVRAGEELAPDMVLEQAAAWGYRRVGMVSQPGEMALRGDLLDIYPPGHEHPLRLEFFGDTLESLRAFDANSQRSLAPAQRAVILPVAPAILAEPFVTRARENWARLAQTGELGRAAQARMEEMLLQGDGTIFPGLFYDQPVPLEAWLPGNAVYVLAQSSNLRPRLEEQEFGWVTTLEKTSQQQGFPWPRHQLLWPEAMARRTWRDKSQLVFEDLVIGHEKHGVDLPERKIENFQDLFWRPDEARRPWSTLVAGLRRWEEERRQVLLSFHSRQSRRKFLKLCEHEGVALSLEQPAPGKPGLHALVSPLRRGMELSWCNCLVLPEDVLQPGAERQARSRPEKGFKGLAAFDDVNPGDLLVHRDYGLARFEGLSRLSVDQAANDYLLLVFDGDDRLYLPVDRLNLVQRYKGPEGADPSLDRLGGTRWKSSREKARKAIERIAQDLVEMYAYRRVAKGYAYGPVDELYWEFEATFGFEETPDQDRAIAEVLEDMERPEPMDRLVCGDVGFGKTEVAMRAAFRAVLDGKQVALLCPTTVLAEQHYQNFSKRLEGFPVQIGMLSRFVPPKRARMVTEAAAKGELDILIGTHRMLSKDVSFPRLGLIILDEEQRFGVKHKEKLKLLKRNVDALTLTATPIPRTLQLSLSGLRGLSVMETPPADRKPVETALVDRDERMLANILARELERGGQVFWVHNRVQSLPQAADLVRKLAPGARIGMAHGQMAEKDLEEAMHGFWHGEIDVLVCTAIVESGLDFPRANTLVVDNAHMFGLGQLYQLRGRVGRSERQAYAYFVVSSLDHVPELARKRLQVILDMDYLGAGFQIAMEDLRLRGAGNILGEAQSGQIARIGLDLFLEMLDEEVRRVKGEPAREEVETELNLSIPARIPETYVPDPRERLRLYKNLTAAQGEAGLAEVMAGVRDRFGHAPEELENFAAVLGLKRVLTRLGVRRADVHAAKVALTWDEKSQAVDPQALLAWIAARPAEAKLFPPAKLELRLDQALPTRRALERAAQDLAGLLP